jgi:hypothetical protein
MSKGRSQIEIRPGAVATSLAQIAVFGRESQATFEIAPPVCSPSQIHGGTNSILDSIAWDVHNTDGSDWAILRGFEEWCAAQRCGSFLPTFRAGKL